MKTARETNLPKMRKRIMYGIAFVFILIFALIFWVTQPLILLPKINNPEVSINPKKLEKHVRKLSEDFHKRNFANQENLYATAEYIKSEFKEAGGKVSEQTFKSGNTTYKNIIAVFGAETDEKIVIGAHYDSAFDTPGADDNASGIAGLIELAYLFGKNQPAMQLELVAYTLEEPPFFATEKMGSYIHAESLNNKQAKVHLMICLEMIGYFSDEPKSQDFPVSLMKLFYPSKGDFVAIVGNFTNVLTVRKFKGLMSKSTSLPIYSINAPTFLPGVDFSDHKNYWKFGYSAVMITDTAFYRNKNYHTTEDTAEKLDYLRMAEVVKATYNAVNEISKR